MACESICQCAVNHVVPLVLDVAVPVAVAVGILGFGFSSPAVAAVAVAALVVHAAAKHFSDNKYCHLIAAPLAFGATLFAIGSFGAFFVIDPIGAIVVGGALALTRLAYDVIRAEEREKVKHHFLCC